MDSAHIQSAIAALVQQVSLELTTWIEAQKSLGADGFPPDDPSWPGSMMPRQTAPALAHPSRPAPPPHATPLPSTTATTTATLHAFQSLRDKNPSRRLLTLSQLAPEERKRELDRLRESIEACRRCPAGDKSPQKLLPNGPLDPLMMFISGGAARELSLLGTFLQGDAGALLSKILSALENLNPSLTRDRIYFTHLIKCACHSAPDPQKVAKTCLETLRREVILVRPKIIIVWGNTAYRGLFDDDRLLSQVRGTWLRFENIPTMVTHHPDEMLKNPKLKGPVWADLQNAVKTLSA